MSVITAVQWALTQQGVTENPPGSNHVTYWDAYRAETGTDGQGWPWCGAFLREALKHGGWTPPADWISVWAIENWGRANSRWHDGAAGVQPGDCLVLFGHGQHTGMATGTLADGSLATIEGNTSSGSAGSQSNGGGVFSRLRPASIVIGYVRPPLPADSPVPAHPSEEDDDMDRLALCPEPRTNGWWLLNLDDHWRKAVIGGASLTSYRDGLHIPVVNLTPAELDTYKGV